MKPTELEMHRAREIKRAMTSPLSSIYRLAYLPRCATLQVIAMIYRAVTKTGDYKEIMETELYKSKGADYCSILAYVHRAYVPTEKLN